MSEVEIITDGGRRRRWSSAEKLRIVEETLDGRESISAVARRNGVAPNLLYRWHEEGSENSPGGGLLKKPWIADSLSPKCLGGLGMLGRKECDQLELFVAGSLRDLLPADHVLVRVDRVLDLSWLRAEVVGLYCPDNGRPGIDPEVAVRLMLAGFLLRIVQDRRLMREAQVNLAIRWFAGYDLHEALPDHSSLTRIRQRWGEALFRKVFMRIVQDCAQAGLITADTVHMDDEPSCAIGSSTMANADPCRCQHGCACRPAPGRRARCQR